MVEFGQPADHRGRDAVRRGGRARRPAAAAVPPRPVLAVALGLPAWVSRNALVGSLVVWLRPVAGVGDRPLPAVAGRGGQRRRPATSGPPTASPTPGGPGPPHAARSSRPAGPWWRRRARDRDRDGGHRQRAPRRRRAGRPAGTRPWPTSCRVHGIAMVVFLGGDGGGRAAGAPGRAAPAVVDRLTSCWSCWSPRPRSATRSTSPGCRRCWSGSTSSARRWCGSRCCGSGWP